MSNKPRFRDYIRAFAGYRAMFRFFDKFGNNGERANPALYEIYSNYIQKARVCFDSGLDFQPYEVEFLRSIDALNIPHFFDGV